MVEFQQFGHFSRAAAIAGSFYHHHHFGTGAQQAIVYIQVVYQRT
jgi:hypothetical protein